MFDLASNCTDQPIGAATISKRQGISLSYLEQLLLKLKRAGLIKTTKGPSGGYALAKKPAQISIGAIIRATEGPVALASCIGHGAKCVKSGCCSTRSLWSRLSTKISRLFEATTLKDLCREVRK